MIRSIDLEIGQKVQLTSRLSRALSEWEVFDFADGKVHFTKSMIATVKNTNSTFPHIRSMTHKEFDEMQERIHFDLTNRLPDADGS